MIWATVSSRSSFNWFFRASSSLPAKNISIWFWYWPFGDVHMWSHLLGCWKGHLLWPACSLDKTLLAFALLHFVLQGQICLLLQVSLDFLLLHSSPLWWKGHLFWVLVLKGLVRNEAGQRLIEFCQENALVIANTLFQQHKRRLYTWTSPDRWHQN